MSTSPRSSLVRRLSAPLAAAVLAGLCVVSAAASTSALGGHARASVHVAGSAVKAAPSRKEY